MKSFDKLYLKLNNKLVEAVGMDHARYLFALSNSPKFTGNPECPEPDGSNDNSVANVSYVNKAVDYAVGRLKIMSYKGVLNPGDSLPAAKSGDMYKVGGSGFISGFQVHANDMLICKLDTEADIESSWDLICIDESDDIAGPAESTSGNLVAFNSDNGRIVSDSGISSSDLLIDVSVDGGLISSRSGNSVTISTAPVNSITPYTENVSTYEGHTHQISGFVSKVKDEEMNGRLYVSNPSYVSDLDLTLDSLDRLGGYRSDNKLGISGLGSLNLGIESESGAIDALGVCSVLLHELKLVKNEVTNFQSGVGSIESIQDSLATLTSRIESLESSLSSLDPMRSDIESIKSQLNTNTNDV